MAQDLFAYPAEQANGRVCLDIVSPDFHLLICIYPQDKVTVSGYHALHNADIQEGPFRSPLSSDVVLECCHT